MTTWFERGAGSEETLLALYEAVRAAEELDLEEQAHDEAFWVEVRALYGLDEADAAGEVAEAAEDANDETDRPSMAQAIGIIEHLLGGRPMHGNGRSTA